VRSDPSPSPVDAALRRLLDEVRTDTSGVLADYIPELAFADPELLGLALVSVTGRDYVAGDSTATFTMQSISKPFVYALAVESLGLDEVDRWVGSEPSGESFNAISFESATGRPANPMINAGAIATSSLVGSGDSAARFEKIRSTLSEFAGRSLRIDDAVYRSEQETGDRNRALAYLMRSAGGLRLGVDDAVDVYFRQCSLLVDTHDVAVMAATLANHGVNPVTGVRVVGEEAARCALAQMATAGMYDHAGEWMLRVGLPAKSGVSGGIVAADPGQFGIGVYSPRLDPRGNSVRGVTAMRALSHDYGLHPLGHTPTADGSAVAIEQGPTGTIVRVRGELDFVVAEQLANVLMATTRGEPGQTLHLDMSAVGRRRLPGSQLLEAMLAHVRAAGATVTVADSREQSD
jgi:glutaminase